MRVLVCGGRMFGEMPDDLIPYSPDWYQALKKQNDEQNLARHTFDDLGGVSAIIHGGAKGADRRGAWWAKRNRLPAIEFAADWTTSGRAAGPIRNQRMIDEGKPDLVVAFPGGRGTADMVRRAKAAGIPVREIAATPTPKGQAVR